MAEVPERVADYPRPPALVASDQRIEVRALGELLVQTDQSIRVLETFHPPTVYVPAEAVRLDRLELCPARSFCEWKGVASYYSVVAQGRRIERAAWSYANPTAAFSALAGWFSFYPGLMDGCWVDGEQVLPQPGGFYGGWITSAVEGPFKGDPSHPELI